MIRLVALLLTLTVSANAPAFADGYPAPKEADWIAPTFRFHTGETLENLRLHYTTIGLPTNPPVLILHGTAGSAATMLGPTFAGQLFGPGQPLDAAKYYLIIPDALGAGQSAKPSDGLRARFPAYDYEDMVQAQYRLITEGLGLKHLRLILGNSMGGMHAWLWAATHPDFADALVPMAAQPTPMAGRNWMMRRMLIESIRRDPAYANGNYTEQPGSLRLVNAMFGLATSGGTLAYQSQGPTRERADKIVEERLAVPPPQDANDFLYQWDASRTYDPTPLLAKIHTPILAINSADDERNPPETGLMVEALKQIKSAQLYLIPATPQTRGHGTTGIATFYAPQLATFLAGIPGM